MSVLPYLKKGSMKYFFCIIYSRDLICLVKGCFLILPKIIYWNILILMLSGFRLSLSFSTDCTITYWITQFPPLHRIGSVGRDGWRTEWQVEIVSTNFILHFPFRATCIHFQGASRFIQLTTKVALTLHPVCCVHTSHSALESDCAQAIVELNPTIVPCKE